jgi:hypothetical protein
MKGPRYFVVVFGNPEVDGAAVDSGVYNAAPGYPRFTVERGDVLLLYCTEKYTEYSQEVPGIGIVLCLTQQDGLDSIKYRWMPFSQSIRRSAILQGFEPDDAEKLKKLGVKARRVIPVSKESFLNVVTGQSLDWEKLSKAD